MWATSKKILDFIFHTTASVLYGKQVGKYSTVGSPEVKNLTKGGITIDHVNNISVNNSNVVLDVGR